MNNRKFINNLKNIKEQKKENISSSTSDKFNPDVSDEYKRKEDFRDKIKDSYVYTNAVWKPVIGSINKSIITQEDLKVPIEATNTEKIMSRYDLELEERSKEKDIVEQKIEEYNKTNKIEKINEQLPDTITIINNTFEELKSSAQNIKKKNDITSEDIADSVSKLDKLLNDIKNL